MKKQVSSKLIQKVVSVVASTVAVTATYIFMLGAPAYAVTCPGGGVPPDGDVANCPKSTTPTNSAAANTCANATSGSAEAQGCTVSLGGTLKTGDAEGKYTCGKGTDNVVHVAFDFGCVGGTNSFTGQSLNPIVDIAFAIFRFLSAGVGIIVIGSIVVAGIQYTVSRGEPAATAAAIKRITNSLIGLLMYIFMFSIANFLVPGGMFIR